MARKSAKGSKSVRLACTLTGLAGAAMWAAGPAQAASRTAGPNPFGTNGQELQICNLHKPSYFFVSGYNQRGSQAYYSGYAPNGGCATTNGYYWKGQVFISDYNGGTIYHKEVKSVPTRYPSNVYTVYL